MNLNTLFSTLLFLLVLCFRCNSQELNYNENYGGFVDGSVVKTNVNHYTGTLNVSIPIKKFNVRGHLLSLVLNHDGSGVRVNQHPSWVGQNWNLTCGGAVVRIVRNKVDEYQNFQQASNGNTNSSTTSSLSYFNNCTSTTLKSFSLQSIADSASLKGYDFEPDEFVFNFMGHSGSFILGNDGKWKVKSDDHIQVDFYLNSADNYCVPLIDNDPYSTNYPKVIAGFVLKTNDGTKYYFGYDKDAIEFQKPFFEMNAKNGNEWVSSAWYLTRIVDNLNNEVYSLKYSRGNYTANLYRNDGTINFSNEEENSVTLDSSEQQVDVEDKCPTADVRTNVVMGRLISPVYLESIYSDNNLLAKFNTDVSNERGYNVSKPNYRYYDLKWMKLASITIPSDSINVLFTYNDSKGLVNRLCLERVGLKSFSCSGVSNLNNNANYTFRYNNFNSIPDYLSGSFDAWGYCSTPFSIDKSKLDKFRLNFDFEKVKCGSLERITYPNGRYSMFDYEPHDYNSFVNRIKNVESLRSFSSEIASGLRIKKIYDYDGTNMNYKYYTYLKNRGQITQASSGVLYAKPRYYEYDKYDQKKYFSINGLGPLSSFDDFFISYSQVQENSQDESYTDYAYSDFASDMDLYPKKIRYIPNDNDKFTSLSSRRGLLTEMRSYNALNKLTAYIKNKYAFPQRDSVKASCLKYDKYCDGSRQYTGGVYYHLINKPLLTQKIECEIVGSKAHITELTYDYKFFDNFPYVSSESKCTRTSSEKVFYTYPFDVENNDTLKLLVNSFVINNPIRKVFFKNGRLIKMSQMSYSEFNEEILPNIVEEKNEGGVISKDYFTCYDNYGNLVESKNKNGVSNLVIYSYKSKYPVFNITNIDYWAFNKYAISKGYSISQIEEMISDDEIKIAVEKITDGFKLKFPESKINCSLYKNGLKIRDYNDGNRFVDYEYDHYLRLTTVRDKERNIVKNYEYIFGAFKEYDGLFYNTKETKIFLKNDCDCSKVGGKYLFTLPKATIVSLHKEEMDRAVGEKLGNDPRCYGGQYLANKYGNCNKPYARIATYPVGEYKTVKGAYNTWIIEQKSDIVLFLYTDPYSRTLFNPKKNIGYVLQESFAFSESLVLRAPQNPVYQPGAGGAEPKDGRRCSTAGGYSNKVIKRGNICDSVNIIMEGRPTYTYRDCQGGQGDQLYEFCDIYRYSFNVPISDFFDDEDHPRYFYSGEAPIIFKNENIPGYKQLDCGFKIPYGVYVHNDRLIAGKMLVDSVERFKANYPFFNAYIKTDGADFDILNFDKRGNGYSQDDRKKSVDSNTMVKSISSWIKVEEHVSDNKKFIGFSVDVNKSERIRDGYVEIYSKETGGNSKLIRKIHIIQD